MYLEKLKLEGQTALITGGAQAIGLACVEALAEASAKVVIADNRMEAAETGRDAMRCGRKATTSTCGTPMGRMGEVDEIASVVLFLAGRGASLMTGSVVVVDGGYTCW
jgi:NAD(P)-dependent dehydrogenase (short-subunit alcohol dehydrogenase family)